MEHKYIKLSDWFSSSQCKEMKNAGSLSSIIKTINKKTKNRYNYLQGYSKIKDFLLSKKSETRYTAIGIAIDRPGRKSKNEKLKQEGRKGERIHYGECNECFLRRGSVLLMHDYLCFLYDRVFLFRVD